MHIYTAILLFVSQTPPPYLPYEFTYEGMLERVAIYLENQEFCVPHEWPLQSELITRISDGGESCKDSCHKQGMLLLRVLTTSPHIKLLLLLRMLIPKL